MNIATVPYDVFSTSNQAISELGGPWLIESPVVGHAGCGCESQSWCGGYCLSCQVFPGDESRTYDGSFATNISINLAKYGGATSLDFTWNYWPLYCGSNTTEGATIPVNSQVGDAKFDEGIPAVNYTTFFGGARQWDNASKISHSGSTAVVRGSDPNIGYIAISMNVTMEYRFSNDEFLNFYVKSIEFNITTPIQSAAPSSSSATSTQQIDGSSAPSSSTTPPAGVIVGAVVGALAFVALFILAACFLRRRRKNEENPVAGGNTTFFTEPINHGALTPLEEGAVPSPHSNTRYRSAHQASSASLRPASFVTRGPYGPPPIYGPNELIGQDRVPLAPSSPDLARFAAGNRDSVNENLEARLQAAGYLPTEDPSRLTPEEWKNEYGVTKLELRRLQDLYERTQQVQPQ